MALAVLIPGSTGPEVKNLQRALNYHLANASPELKVDGILGPKTKARLVEFQKRFQLKPDGIVGPKTQRALYSFVECSHHLVIRDSAAARSVRGLRGIGDAPSPSVVPPLPRLQLPFPTPFRLPPVLQPPRLQLDPRLLAWLNTRPFEITAGTTMSFKKEGGSVNGFVDVKATIWSKPIGEHLEVSAGPGAAMEARVNDGHVQTSVLVFVKAELKDIVRLGHVDVARLELEGQLSGTPGSKEPADMTATLKGGPTLETKDKRFVFGFGGYMEYKSNGQTHQLSGGVFLEGAYRF